MATKHADDHSIDVAVLGAGTAGLAAYRAASASSDRIVLIEGGVGGTTCARVGCMPSKLLLAAGEAAYHARHAAPFGVHCTVSIDGRAVMDRVRRERDRFVGFVVEGVERIPQSHRIRGQARFVAPQVLEVAGRRIEARAIVIATGSSPYVPPMFESIRERLVVNDDVFAWESLPASVAVFGTGVIGLELSQALSRLGVRVRLFGRSGTVGPISDPVVRAAALAVFRKELPIDPAATIHGVRLGGDGVEVDFDDEHGNATRESFEFALIATGRTPNLRDLGLENAGLSLDANGVPRFDRETLQCGATPVFIAGDANADVPLLHEAADEGRIAGENARAFPKVKPGLRRSALAITFSDPQIAVVGPRFSEIAQNKDIVIGKVSFEDQGRSRVMLQNRGIAHVYADAVSGLFLGAQIVGPRAEHLGHLLAWAHQQGSTIDAMLAMPFYHPVVEEGIRTALRDASAQLAARAAVREQALKATKFASV